MTVNSINLAQNLLTPNNGTHNQANIAFRGEAPDLDALRAKQDEFRRMSEQAGGDKGVLGKMGSFATKALGVVIAFTAAKICLGKAAEMITGTVGKYADKAVAKAAEKAAEKAAGKTAEEAAKITSKADKLAKIVDKVRKSKIDEYAVNLIAGGAAVGVAMRDFGLVKKEVSSNTENLVDNAIDKATESSYNSYGDSDLDSTDEEF